MNKAILKPQSCSEPVSKHLELDSIMRKMEKVEMLLKNIKQEEENQIHALDSLYQTRQILIKKAQSKTFLCPKIHAQFQNKTGQTSATLKCLDFNSDENDQTLYRTNSSNNKSGKQSPKSVRTFQSVTKTLYSPRSAKVLSPFKNAVIRFSRQSSTPKSCRRIESTSSIRLDKLQKQLNFAVQNLSKRSKKQNTNLPIINTNCNAQKHKPDSSVYVQKIRAEMFILLVVLCNIVLMIRYL